MVLENMGLFFLCFCKKEKNFCTCSIWTGFEVCISLDYIIDYSYYII